jgi:hypothetical protein
VRRAGALENPLLRADQPLKMKKNRRKMSSLKTEKNLRKMSVTSF